MPRQTAKEFVELSIKIAFLKRDSLQNQLVEHFEVFAIQSVIARILQILLACLSVAKNSSLVLAAAAPNRSARHFEETAKPAVGSTLVRTLDFFSVGSEHAAVTEICGRPFITRPSFCVFRKSPIKGF